MKQTKLTPRHANVMECRMWHRYSNLCTQAQSSHKFLQAHNER